MTLRFLLSGLLGGVALLLWTIVMNVGFQFSAKLWMNEVPNADSVYKLLKEQVTAPGAYLANPAPLPDGRFPPGEPVFGIHYGGVGHEAAGSLVVVECVVAFGSALLAAGLLSLASSRVISRYWNKVLYVAVIGVLLALFGDIPKYGIGGYPASSALLLAANHAASWAMAGLAMAWVMRVPVSAAGAA